MNQEKALEIMSEVYAAYAKILPKPIHDAFLYGDYATGRYDAESSVDILIAVDMSWEDLRPYESQLAHIDSELSLKFDVTVFTYTTPLESFERNYGYFIYGNVREEGIRYAA